MEVLIITRSEFLASRISAALASMEDVSLISQSLNSTSIIPIIERLKPAVVVLDIYPDRNNYLIEVNQMRKTNPDIIFVMLIDNSPEQYAEAFRKLGITYCIDKTDNLSEITEIIKDIRILNTEKQT